jgi:hypothetical protein
MNRWRSGALEAWVSLVPKAVQGGGSSGPGVDRALEFGPDTVAAFLGRGLWLPATGQAARAVAALDQAIAKGNEEALSHRLRGKAMEETGEFEEPTRGARARQLLRRQERPTLPLSVKPAARWMRSRGKRGFCRIFPRA